MVDMNVVPTQNCLAFIGSKMVDGSLAISVYTNSITFLKSRLRARAGEICVVKSSNKGRAKYVGVVIFICRPCLRYLFIIVIPKLKIIRNGSTWNAFAYRGIHFHTKWHKPTI